LRSFDGPADAFQCDADPTKIEIGDGDDTHSRYAVRLGEEHRAELAGADQTYPYRRVTVLSFPQF
jgi:hypothetical protein